MLPQREETDASREMARTIKNSLAEGLEKDEAGRLKLTVTLPDAPALDDLAYSLAQLLNPRN